MPKITKTFTREMYNAYFRAYNKIPKNKAKRQARHAVYVELRAGRLKKKPCLVCGKRKVEAHHEDHKKFLQITWLCKTCHVKVHRGAIKVFHSLPLVTNNS